ncbi:EamA family transporter RarD [Gottfriedia sp. OAE603]|uniref:EamA family transporter RarD n=1 Tax=Gottfriedia sp. OAE603 TaxID=2663872 RepID=UPI0036710955
MKGILYGVFAYVLWGILPIYWKLVQDIAPFEILTHRIMWSFVTLLIFIFLIRKGTEFKETWKQVIGNKKVLFSMILVSLLISTNWLLYIWAVNSNHILDASLGYYINPLVSIILGVIVLKEKLSFWQIFSVCLATIGVGGVFNDHFWYIANHRDLFIFNVCFLRTFKENIKNRSIF